MFAVLYAILFELDLDYNFLCKAELSPFKKELRSDL